VTPPDHQIDRQPCRTAQISVLTETTLDTVLFQSKPQPDAHATDQQSAA
jgi:hypothetical protein